MFSFFARRTSVSPFAERSGSESCVLAIPYLFFFKVRFSDFPETWHTFSTPKVIFLIFGVWRENFLMVLKIDFNCEVLGILRRRKKKKKMKMKKKKEKEK